MNVRVTEVDIERLVKWRTDKLWEKDKKDLPNERLLIYALEHLRRLRRAALALYAAEEDINESAYCEDEYIARVREALAELNKEV